MFHPSPKSPRGASRTTGGQIGHQKETTMPRIVLVLVALAAAIPLNAAAQAGTSTPVDVHLAPGGSVVIKVTAEPGTTLVAPKPPPVVRKADPKVDEKNCVAGGGTWDGTKPVPASQSDVDQRCDLTAKNAKRTSVLDGFAFCNKPEDPALERQVYGEWECVAWAARRADRAAADRRAEAKIKAALEAIPPVDLKPLETRITDEVKRLDGEDTKLREETVRLDGEIKKLAEKLARSPECAELATKGAALLDEVAADGTKTGQAKFEKCLDDPKTDPVARIAIIGVRVAQQKAEQALATAQEALASSRRSNIRFGATLGFAAALRPALSSGTFALVGGKSVGGELAFALAKEGWRVAFGLGYGSETGHVKDASGNFKATTFGASAFSLRLAHYWTVQGTGLSGGFTALVKGSSTGGEAFGLVDPRVRSLTVGLGVGGEYAFTDVIYMTAVLDLASIGTTAGRPIVPGTTPAAISATEWSPDFFAALGFRF